MRVCHTEKNQADNGVFFVAQLGDVDYQGVISFATPGTQDLLPGAAWIYQKNKAVAAVGSTRDKSVEALADLQRYHPAVCRLLEARRTVGQRQQEDEREHVCDQD